MLSLIFRIPAGRLHATAWDHHPNEGLAEWPPSPWRILRALRAAAARLPQAPDRALLHRLLVDRLGAPPVYQLPAFTTGHTRQTMAIEGGNPRASSTPLSR